MLTCWVHRPVACVVSKHLVPSHLRHFDKLSVYPILPLTKPRASISLSLLIPLPQSLFRSLAMAVSSAERKRLSHVHNRGKWIERETHAGVVKGKVSAIIFALSR